MSLLPALPANPVFVAVDTPDVAVATRLAARLHDEVGGLKLGLEFFVANGPKGVREVVKAGGLPLFLDLKFHDIPNTVAGAIRSAGACKPAIVNVHAAGGRAMMRAAAAAAVEGADLAKADTRPLVIAVTLLTSLDAADVAEIGYGKGLEAQALDMARLAQDSGLDGVVCSPHEAFAIRRACGPDFKLIVPGVRPNWAVSDDQKRFTTPAEALDAGADVLVVGRPITAADDPAAAARRIATELPRPGDACR